LLFFCECFISYGEVVFGSNFVFAL